MEREKANEKRERNRDKECERERERGVQYGETIDTVRKKKKILN